MGLIASSSPHLGGSRVRRRVAALLAAATAVGALTMPAAPAGSQAVSDPGAGPVATWGTTTGTDGRVYITDSSGRAQIFHGFNVKTASPAADVTDELLADATSRGLDHLRLGWYWQYLEPEKDQISQSFLDEIETVLDRAEAHGVTVILDMHQDVYGEAFGSEGVPEWATRTDGHDFTPNDNWLLSYLEPAVQAAFEHLYEDPDLRQEQIDAWLSVVERVKDHPALFGYDLLNEPFGKMREGEDLLTAAGRVEREQITAMYQRLTDAISAVDPDHWVFIEPPNIASLGIATSLGEVRGPKVAFYPHMYDPDIEFATYSADGQLIFNRDFFSKWRSAITTYTAKYPMPMLVGEWGLAYPERQGMDQFVDLALSTMEDVTSGWSQFRMCRGGGYCPFDQSGNARPGIGVMFQPYPRAIAGRPVSSHWDRAARTLTVTFEDSAASGPTVIYLDKGHTYPDGWTVETTDSAGSWSSTVDSNGMLSVDTPDTGGRHTICVKPQGSAAGCGISNPTGPPSTTTTTRPGTTTPPPAARPVTASPRYAG